MAVKTCVTMFTVAQIEVEMRVGSPLFVSNLPFSFELEVLSFVSNPLCPFKSFLLLEPCFSFEVSSVRFKAALSFWILPFVLNSLFRWKSSLRFKASLSLEVLSLVGSPLFVSNPLCH